MQNILFVCTGNICRSPTAHGVLEQRIKQAGLGGMISCDSAGTHAYHVGEPPDKRSIHSADKRGIALAHLRARKVTAQDFARFDVILGMDTGHVEFLRRMGHASKANISLFLDFAGLGMHDVPDPYYGGAQDFEHVLNLVEQGVDALLRRKNWLP